MLDRLTRHARGATVTAALGLLFIGGGTEAATSLGQASSRRFRALVAIDWIATNTKKGMAYKGRGRPFGRTGRRTALRSRREDAASATPAAAIVLTMSSLRLFRTSLGHLLGQLGISLGPGTSGSEPATSLPAPVTVPVGSRSVTDACGRTTLAEGPGGEAWPRRR